MFFHTHNIKTTAQCGFYKSTSRNRGRMGTVTRRAGLKPRLLTSKCRGTLRQTELATDSYQEDFCNLYCQRWSRTREREETPMISRSAGWLTSPCLQKIECQFGISASSEHKSLRGEAELLCLVKAESAANVRHAANRMYELQNFPGCGYTCNHCCDLHGHV